MRQLPPANTCFTNRPSPTRREATRRILESMAASDRVIRPDLELRYLPVIRAVGECLHAGVIGHPLMASVCLWCNWGYGGGRWNYNPEEEGFFPWLGCWYLDLLDYVFATPPEQATVTGGYAANGRLMDHGWASLAYPAGRIGRFDFNLVAVAGLKVGSECARQPRGSGRRRDSWRPPLARIGRRLARSKASRLRTCLRVRGLAGVSGGVHRIGPNRTAVGGRNRGRTPGPRRHVGLRQAETARATVVVNLLK